MKIRKYYPIKYPGFGWCVEYKFLDDQTNKETKEDSTIAVVVNNLKSVTQAIEIAEAFNLQTNAVYHDNLPDQVLKSLGKI